MKALALILASSMLFLNMESFLAYTQVAMDMDAAECCSDCCSGCCDTQSDQHNEKESPDTRQDCQPGCACSFQLQLNALAYNLATLSGTVVQSYHYGNYVNSYSFEFSADFLQPPRFG